MRTEGTETVGLRFLIEVPPDDDRGLGELRTSLRDELGPDWQVSYLFPQPRTKDLSRFFVTRGQVPASPAYPLSALGYDMARGLADRLGAVVEPDLPSSAYRQDGPNAVSVRTPSLPTRHWLRIRVSRRPLLRRPTNAGTSRMSTPLRPGG